LTQYAYRTTGGGLMPSPVFAFSASPGEPETVTVHGVSRSVHGVGLALSVLGGAALFGGVAVSMSSFMQSLPEGDHRVDPGPAPVLLGVGAVMAIAGFCMLVPRTSRRSATRGGSSSTLQDR
jgi:hypothetical protein